MHFVIPLQLLEVIEDWSEALEEGKTVDVVNLDFSKAFDKVSHYHLLKKLESYGIKGNVLSWIKDFLTNLKQQVIINGSKSNVVEVTSGVPQGSVLGPILFLIYINDMPEVVNCFLKLFADDSKLYNICSTQEQRILFQESIDNICKWTTDWLMQLNTSKCKHMVINNRHNCQDVKFTLTQEDLTTEIVKVSEEKDLGITFDDKLKFSQHISNAVKKANRNVGIIFRTFTFLDTTTFLHLYKTLVRPHLEYGSVIWSPLYKKDAILLENVQRRATRLVSELKHLSYTERLKKTRTSITRIQTH